MRYFFILGSNPVLSSAEIIALLDGRHFTVTETYKHALIVEAAPGHEIDAPALMNRLGGTVKIGPLIADEIDLDLADLTDRLADHLLALPRQERLTFGVSVYSLEAHAPGNRAAAAANRLKNLGMEIKSRLLAAGRSSRWVKAQTGAALSSVVVGKNKLIEEGAEFVILTKGDRCRLGVSTVIQPFEDFADVDFGRPERDAFQGMLPPKLARIMINLIHVSREITDIRLLDPFCGSGTILSEALRMGFSAIVGSDLSPVAVDNTAKNLAWVTERWPTVVPQVNRELLVCDAREIGNRLAPQSVAAIVTEPFLGPPLYGTEKRGELQRRLSELQRLYHDSLAGWRKILKPGAPVVVAFPVYICGLEKHGISVSDFESLGYRPDPLLPAVMLARLGVRETKNKGLLYGRNDQHVWREIVRLRLQN